MTDDAFPPILSHQHRHVCGCGDYLVCSTEPDQCCVTEPFMCSRCDMAERDAYFDAQSSMNAIPVEAWASLFSGPPLPSFSFWRNQPTPPTRDWQRMFRGGCE